MLRNHFLLNSFLSQDSFFKDLHWLAHIHLYLIYEQGRVLLQRGLAIETARRAAAAKSDTPLEWKITRARSNPPELNHGSLFIHFVCTPRDSQQKITFTLPASDVITSSVDITQNSLCPRG
jgi:hypothetical protein